MTHIMLDIETWGKRPGCDIRSIGACVFAPVARHGKSLVHDGSLGTIKPFYVATHPVANLHHDFETVRWWNGQSAEAQAAFADPVDLHDACEQFTNWLHGLTTDDPSEIRVWANDPQFDVSILEAVYHAVGLPVPWHYRAPRSFRTVTELASMTHEDFAAFNHGTAHNALDDAISQAKIVCEAYKRLGIPA